MHYEKQMLQKMEHAQYNQQHNHLKQVNHAKSMLYIKMVQKMCHLSENETYQKLMKKLHQQMRAISQ
ncbi:MAG TPA: hypothetical protein DCM22_08965 [Lachnospiraceae bacterium]|nr:hypothetical protein [Lachnospiraceae bacterium]